MSAHIDEAAVVDTEAERDAHEAALLRAFLAEIPELVYFKDVDSRILAVSEPLEAPARAHGVATTVGYTDQELWPALGAKTLADEQEITRTGRPKLGSGVATTV